MEGATNSSSKKETRRMTLSTLGNLIKDRSAIINSLASKRRSSLDTENNTTLKPLPVFPSNVVADINTDNNNDAKLPKINPPTDADESASLALKHLTKWKKFVRNKATLEKCLVASLENSHITYRERRRSSVTSSEVFTKTRRFSCNLDAISSQISTSSNELGPQNVQGLPKERRGSVIFRSLCHPGNSDQTDATCSITEKTQSIGQIHAARRSTESQFTVHSTTKKENAANSFSSTRFPGNKSFTSGGNKVNHRRTPLPALPPRRITKVTHRLHRGQSSVWTQSVRVNSKLQRYLQETKSSYPTAKLKLIQESLVDQDDGLSNDMPISHCDS